MKKFKILFCASILSFGMISYFNQIPTYATTFPTTSERLEVNAIGGWSEENGYFVNEKQYYNIVNMKYSPTSSPVHTGSAEVGVSANGTTRKRSHGQTSWYGKYHYTRALVEGWFSVLTDSGRQWGYDRTSATSPWWYFDGDTLGIAKSFYGSL